ncbi:MAG: radical SAM family heme chaperone HemW [Lachnospiraceae bacterium]
MEEEQEKSPVSIYLHIPFCRRKCRYCDFLSGPAEEEERSAYLSALAREIEDAGRILRADGRWVDTVFFGGGTPTILSALEIEHLLFLLSLHFSIESDAEITMECNPGTVDYEKLCSLREMGVNRLSIGVQSFRDEELRLLGRIHDRKTAEACIGDARRAGFANLNLDLMSALPGQTYAHWMENLKTAVSFDPEHLSCYSLILEDGTDFYRMQQKGELPPLPSDEEDRRMYHDTGAFLQEHGYQRYEISNYAKPGFSCRHNEGYWTGHPYLGLGAGAASLYRHVRFTNTRDLTAYTAYFSGGGTAFDLEHLSGGTKTYEKLSREDEMSEFMFLGLRRMAGVSFREFAQRFGVSLSSVFGEPVRRHISEGLLARDGDSLFLTERGIDISNFVLCDFLLT